MEEEWYGNYNKASEDKKLELRLAPPGQFLNTINNGAKRDRIEEKSTECKIRFSCYDILISSPCSIKSSNFQNLNEMQKQQQEQKLQCLEMKACSGPATATATATASNRKRPETSRVTASQAVGWPPIRSFRRNLGSSSKANKSPAEDDLFVKVNMEGVPIGRKININAYDSYQKLSVAIDELFRALLAAQRESCGAKAIDVNENGSGEYKYTLVYEDREGDTILVGDVPWQMFIRTAKRLRVLRSSEN